MAISIDTVYQRVLALANKEQRGYITPQEFNLLANQAQLSIFESYFYSKNHRERTEQGRTDVSESNISELLDRKLAAFATIEAVIGGHTFPGHYQIGDIYLDGYVCKKVSPSEAARLKASIRHSSGEPIYTDSLGTGEDLTVFRAGGSVATGVTCEVFNKPAPAAWGYVVVQGKALYNADTTTDFELHDSEENTLVTNILGLAGIVLNKVGLAQTALGIASSEQQLQNT